MNRKAWLQGMIFILTLIITASILAYLGLFPAEIRYIPYYDSIGHFLLFGLLTLMLDKVFREKNLLLEYLPFASVIVTCYALIDESLQYFSSVRSFDWTDFLYGFIGIVIFTFISRFIFKN